MAQNWSAIPEADSLPPVTGLACESELSFPPRPKRSQVSAFAHSLAANWFAAYTYSHHEKKIASRFRDREIEFFLPLYAARHRWKNHCAMNLELPLFPNYIFVRIERRQRVRVLEVPGVLSLVGFGPILAPLPDFEVEALRSGVGQRRIEPHPFLVIGERVRIKRGPMTGIEGVLLRKKNDFRVVLALDVIMRCVAVEVDAEDVEPAHPSASRQTVAHDLAGRSLPTTKNVAR
jgi:transcription antitermination factor NusG